MKIKINKIFGQYNNEINFDNKINIFIGENGIGKSTTISILKCLLEFRYIKLQDYYFESIEIINDNDTVTIKYSDLCLTNDYIYENYKIQYNSEEPSDMLMEFLNELDYRKLYKLNKDFRLLNNKRDLRYFVNDGFNDGFLSYIEPIIKNIYLKSKIVVEDGYYYQDSNMSNLHVKIKSMINELKFNDILFLKLSNDYDVTNLFNNELIEDIDQNEEYKAKPLLSYRAKKEKRYLDKKYIDKLKENYQMNFEKERISNKLNISKLLFSNIYSKKDIDTFKENLYDFIYENIDNTEKLQIKHNISKTEYNKILAYIKPLLPENNILNNKLNEGYNDIWFKDGDGYELLCALLDKFGNKYLNIKNDKLDKLNNIFKKYFNNKEVIATPFGILISTSDYKNDIYFNELSEGEKKIIILFTTLVFSDNMIVLIDEPETSLSAVWQKELIKDIISCNYNRLIIATQSPYIVSHDEYLDYLICLPMEKNNEL